MKPPRSRQSTLAPLTLVDEAARPDHQISASADERRDGDTTLRELPAAVVAPGELVERARVLDGFYIPTRYPNGHAEGAPHEHYGALQSDEAIRHARAIVDFVRSQLA